MVIPWLCGCVTVWPRTNRPRSASIVSNYVGTAALGCLADSKGQQFFNLDLLPLGMISAGRGRVARGHTTNFASGRRAFYFDSCPFFEQGQGRGVIEILVSIFGGHFIDFFDGFERRQFDANFFRRFERQSNVFVHEA